jgi:hypothetical protein
MRDDDHRRSATLHPATMTTSYIVFSTWTLSATDRRSERTLAPKVGDGLR